MGIKHEVKIEREQIYRTDKTIEELREEVRQRNLERNEPR